MKVVTQITILDDNNNIVVQDSFDKPYVQNENQDVEHEVVHTSTGGPVLRPKQPPKH